MGDTVPSNECFVIMTSWIKIYTQNLTPDRSVTIRTFTEHAWIFKDLDIGDKIAVNDGQHLRLFHMLSTSRRRTGGGIATTYVKLEAIVFSSHQTLHTVNIISSITNVLRRVKRCLLQ